MKKKGVPLLASRWFRQWWRKWCSPCCVVFQLCRLLENRTLQSLLSYPGISLASSSLDKEFCVGQVCFVSGQYPRAEKRGEKAKEDSLYCIWKAGLHTSEWKLKDTGKLSQWLCRHFEWWVPTTQTKLSGNHVPSRCFRGTVVREDLSDLSSASDHRRTLGSTVRVVKTWAVLDVIAQLFTLNWQVVGNWFQLIQILLGEL